MEMPDFRKQYEAMTNDELLNLALDSDQISPEARRAFDSELFTRGIGRGEIDEYRQGLNKHTEDKEYSVDTLFPSLRRIRAALQGWRKYRRQTGEWPLRSITFYFVHLVAALAASILVVAYGVLHGWSRGVFLIIVLPPIALDVFVSSWLEDKLRLFEIARHRRARGQSFRPP